MWHSPVFICISPNRIPVKNENNICQGLWNAGGFIISLISPFIAFNEIYCGARYRYNNIYRREETCLSDLRNLIIQSGIWQSVLENRQIFINFPPTIIQYKKSLNFPNYKTLRT
jgi:hypothetical protein